MSVNAYEDIILGSLAQFLDLSKKIGDDVATQADFVKKAFDAQFEYVKMASQSSAPDQSELPKLLQPTSDQITAIQNFREKHRTSKLFNHLSAISESIPALGWVCVVSEICLFLSRFAFIISIFLSILVAYARTSRKRNE
jgi:adenylyl cyclase-associated protein